MQTLPHAAGPLLSFQPLYCLPNLRGALHRGAGRFGEAEEEFVRGGKPKEAIDMWCHQQDWAAALNVANTSDPASVPAICAMQVGGCTALPFAGNQCRCASWLLCTFVAVSYCAC